MKQNFIDQVKIFIKAGDGGNGILSFRRERFVPKGGPDGGDGGKGGDIIFQVSENLSSLYDYLRKRHFKAESGKHGSGRQKTGASGDDLILKVPPGTLIKDSETGELLHEFPQAHGRSIIQKGGRGGLGNIHFKSATNQSPRKATKGEKVEGRWVDLELKVLADVGILGPPNAGKSSLLTKITRAQSKIGAYPFTTLHPRLGVLNHQDKYLRLADLPGLISGAHQGVGLGNQFLKHVERSRALLIMVEAYPEDPQRSAADFTLIQHELEYRGIAWKQKNILYALNKLDLLEKKDISNYVAQVESFLGTNAFGLSVALDINIEELKMELSKLARRKLGGEQ